MSDVFDPAERQGCPGGTARSDSAFPLGIAAPIAVRGVRLAAAVTPGPPRNRRERLSRLKRLRELASGKDRQK